MPKPLVVVESPAKAKTLSKFLGNDYDVRASVGHVADLPSKGLNIDVDNGFKPTYELTERGKTVIKELQGRAEGRLGALSRDRRRPRGRGHLVAPPRVPEAEGAREADGVPRDHQVGDRPRRQQPAQPRLRPRRRRRDPPHPRPALRLRGVAGALAPCQPRPVGRSRAEPVGPPDRRARARTDRLRVRRLLGHRRRHGDRAELHGQARHASTAPRSPPARTSTTSASCPPRRSRSTKPAPAGSPTVSPTRRSRSARSRRSRTARRRRRRS